MSPTIRRAELPVAILTPAGDGESEFMRWLKDFFPRARMITPDNAKAELSQCLDEHLLLIVPRPRSLPQNIWNDLQCFLDGNGAALFVGFDPLLDRTITTSDGRWTAEQTLLYAQVTNAQIAARMPSILAWEHRNAQGEIQGTVRKALAPLSDWSAVRIELDRLDHWDALMITNLPQKCLSDDFRAMVFFARGSEQTFRLFVECEERDSSWWRASIPLERFWKPIRLHEVEFEFVSGPPGRGHPADHLSYSKLNGIRIGVSASKDLQGNGPQQFELSEVRWLADAREIAQVQYWPDIPLLTPPYRYYNGTARKFHSLVSRHSFTFEQGLHFQSPFPRAKSTGGDAAANSRWIPLIEARDEHDVALGWPASLYVEIVSNRVARRWAWIGFPDDAPKTLMATSIETALQRLHSCIFLHHVGQPTFTITEGQPAQVTARMAAATPQETPFDMIAELRRADGSIPGRRIPASASFHTASRFALGLAPSVSPDTEVWQIHFELRDPARRLHYDMLDQWISARPRASTPEDAHRITMTGPNLAFRGRRVFLFGAHYRPHSSIGLSALEKAYADWLAPGLFDPMLVERDFDRLVEGGANCVAVDYTEPYQASALKFVIDAAKRRGLWILVRLPVNPLNPDTARLQALLQAADLAAEPTVFALDLAANPLCSSNDLEQLNAAWLAWLIEQYGSIEQACESLGIPDVTPPTAELSECPPVSVPAIFTNTHTAAAFHRFTRDLLSRRYGYLVRCLRSWGVRQLITRSTTPSLQTKTQCGWDRAWTDPTVGSIHFDFICPRAWNLSFDEEAMAQVAFVTAYCRGMAGSKPVIWTDFGVALPRNPREIEMKAQAKKFEQFFNAAFMAKSAGVFAREYAGGWQPGENADWGIVAPEGTWRPVVAAYRKFVNRMRRDRGQPEPWGSREISPDIPQSCADLWDTWRAIYLEDMRAGSIGEVRPTNFVRRSSELTPTGLDGAPLRCRAPIQSLNAEWGRIEINGAEWLRSPQTTIEVKRGAKVCAELLNSGAVLWDASMDKTAKTVWVRVTNGRRAPTLLPVPLTAPGKSARVLWIATEVGEWIARPWLADVEEFGEALRIKVSE